MPKIRNKNSIKGFSKIFSGSPATLIKSGICTKSIKQIIKDEQKEYSFFHDEILHSETGEFRSTQAFNDDHTIIFKEKEVIPGVGIEGKYLSGSSLVLQDKILDTPNEFLDRLYYTVNGNPGPETYNALLKENYVKDYNIKYIEKKPENSYDNYDKIDLDFELDSKGVCLSYNKTEESSSSVNFWDGSVKTFNKHNGNTIFLYKPSYDKNQDNIYKGSTYDYIGNIGKNYFSSKENFSSSSICFNSLTSYDTSQNSNGNNDNFSNAGFGSLPIEDFGFPYDNKFLGRKRHTVEMSNYIVKPFLIEKVVLETTLSNWSVSNTPGFPCLNFLNFFIINQRGNLNKDSLLQSNTIKYKNSSGNIDNFTRNINYSNLENYTCNYSSNYVFETSITEASISSDFVVNESLLNEENQTVDSQRELVTTINIANYSSGDQGDSRFNIDKIKEEVDLFIDNSNVTKLQNNYAECIYLDKSIRIESDVKSFNSNENLTRFSSFEIYPKKSDSTRTNIDKRSEKSLLIEADSRLDFKIENDTLDQTIKIKAPIKKKNKYFLNAGDKLIFGFSFSPSFAPDSNSLYGNDVTKILNNVKVILLGRYLENGIEKSIKKKKFFQNKNTKKIGYYSNEIVDNTGMPDAYLNKGSYYDFEASGIAGTDFSSNLYKYSSRVSSGFGNFLTLTNSNDRVKIKDRLLSTIYYRNNASENFDSFIKHYYTLNGFGQPANKINNNRYISYYDMLRNNILTHHVKKKFKKGFFLQKTPGTVSAFLNFDFTAMSNFSGSNFLKEKILLGNAATKDLVFSLNDNFDKHIKVVITSSQLIFDTNTNNIANGDAYLNANFGLGLSDYIVICIENETINAFDRNNGSYSENVDYQKIKFIDRIVEGINNINSNIQLGSGSSQNKDFSIGIIAERFVTNEEPDRFQIKLSLVRKGSINNANVNTSIANITSQNFSLQSGEIINSYNNTDNAIYLDDEILFRE